MMKRAIISVVALVGFLAGSALGYSYDANDASQFDACDIYISSFGDGVLRYDLETRTYVDHAIPVSELEYVEGIAFAPDGLLWACDAYGTVKRFNALGLVDTLAGDSGAEFITFGPDGNAYVGFNWTGSYGIVQKFNGTTGELIGTLLDFNAGSQPDPYGRVGGLAFDPDGNLLVNSSVATGPTSVISKFNPVTGEYLGQLCDLGSPAVSSKGLAVGREGTQLAAAVYYEGKAYRHHPVTGLGGSFLGSINFIRGVTYGPDGSIYLVSSAYQGYGKIVHYDVNDVRTTDFITGVYDPQYVALVPEPVAPPLPECGDTFHPLPVGDFSGDCLVDLQDLSMLVANWLGCTHPDCD